MAVNEVKTYQAFRGVDYSASPAVISEEHAQDMLNMYIGQDGVLQKRPGWHVIHQFMSGTQGLTINGIHQMHGNVLFVHAGDRLYYRTRTTTIRHIQNLPSNPGDVAYDWNNGDIPGASAAAVILGFAHGTVKAEEWQIRNMDIDGDGDVTDDDASLLLWYITNPSVTHDDPADPTYSTVKKANNSDLAMSNNRSVSFEHDGYLYILDGEHYYRIKPTTTTIQDAANREYKVVAGFVGESVKGYVPTTGVNGHYEYDPLNDEGTNTPGSESNPGRWVAPTRDEQRNLLQTLQINTFAADGIKKKFYLLDNGVKIHDLDGDGNAEIEILMWKRCKNVDGEDVPTTEHSEVDTGAYTDPDTGDVTYYYYKDIWTKVKANDATYAWERHDSGTGEDGKTSYIQFTNVPAAHRDNIPNIRVTYTPQFNLYQRSKDRGLIEKCTIMTRFGYYNDNRFWFSGNAEHPNVDYMSAIDDPTYFPANGWTKIGSDLTAIQGYLHYGTELAVIKEDNNQDATVYMRSAILTEDNNVIFPVQQGAQGVGAISKYCLKTLKDEPLFLAREGVYAIQGTDASQERTIPNRSLFIDEKLRSDATHACCAETYKDYYILCNSATGNCWVADGRYMSLPPGSNNRHHVYEWYRWDNVPAYSMLSTDDYLYFGTRDGKLCVFNTDWDDPMRFTDGATFVPGSTRWDKWYPYEGGVPIHAYFVTKRDHLNSVDFKKTMLNDGGVIILRPHERSSASISVTTDKGTWFVDHIQTDIDEPSVVVPIRHRFKNFDSIETRIENKQPKEGLSIIGLQYRYVTTTNRR